MSTKSGTSVLEAADIPKVPLTTPPNPKTKSRVTFASLPCELRDEIYEGLLPFKGSLTASAMETLAAWGSGR